MNPKLGAATRLKTAIDSLKADTDTQVQDVYATIDGVWNELGNLEELETTDKSSLVKAINEVSSKSVELDEEPTDGSENPVKSRGIKSYVEGLFTLLHDNVQTEGSTLGKLYNLIVGNTNSIGTLANLNTTAKTNLVAAINEANAKDTTPTSGSMKAVESKGIKAYVDAAVAAGAIVLRQTKTITSNYTVTAADHNYTIIVNAASPVVITLPSGIAGADMIFKQKGAGTFTFAAGSGATVENLSSKFTSGGVKASATVFSDNANTWTPNGQLV
jgi:hypothetical protein